MAIEIIRAQDPVEVPALVATIYASPGLGKTTLGFAAKRPLLLDFDRGAYRAANRADSVAVKRWADVEGITAEDVADYDTIVVDTAGRALDVLSADIIAGNAKMGNGGALSLQGYGQLKARFTNWVKHIRGMGKDLILLAHSTEDRAGDDVLERLDMQGASKNEVYKVSDLMGRLCIRNRKRVLEFRPTDTTFGKDPAMLGEVAVPDVTESPVFMGDILDRVKARINELTDQQKSAMSAIADWQQIIGDCDDADAINKILPAVKDIGDDYLSRKVKPMLHARATELGLEFSKSAKGYVAPEPDSPDGPDEGDAIDAQVK